MLGISHDERLAVFLTLLGDQAVDLAMKQLPGQRPQQVRKYLDEYRQTPPTDEEIELVLEDFDRYFRFALNTLDQANPPPGDHDSHKKKEVQAPKKKKIRRKKTNSSDDGGEEVYYEQLSFPLIEPSDDPVADLNKLHAYQVAHTIAHDQPKTIAMVLAQIDPSLAAKSLELLPPDIRMSAFLLMSQPITVPFPIVRKVLRSTFERANAIRESQPVVDRVEQLISMLRNMPKAIRSDIMAKLREEKPELAEEIQSKMFDFEDMLRLDDRSVQTVLTKITSDRLVMALTRAPDDISRKILNNMSKRARETMEEEIGFNERAGEKDIDAARTEIAQLLAKMDEAGEISL